MSTISDKMQAALELGWHINLRTHGCPVRWLPEETRDLWARNPNNDQDAEGWFATASCYRTEMRDANLRYVHGGVTHSVDLAIEDVLMKIDRQEQKFRQANPRA